MPNKTISYILATAILLIMFLLMIFATKTDSLIVDEIPHIGAGYSYLTQQDYRLNPEHPPLIKDLGALPLLFMKLNIPLQSKAWQTDINGQWDFGRQLIFQSGNDADKITFWARILPTLLTILLGLFIFQWTSKTFNPIAGVLSLFLFAFSPTFLTHGKFVATDAGAAFGFFTAFIYFIKFLKNPNAKNSIIAGLFFGIAQMLKFSTFLLAPLFLFLALVWLIVNHWQNAKKFIALFILLFIVGYAIIYPIYQFHVWNYPIERQINDTSQILRGFSVKSLANFDVWLASKPALRAYGQYFLGLLMVFQRTTGGNTTYFLGEVTNTGWRSYFPFVYLVKEPLALHILTLVALIFAFWQLKKSAWKFKSLEQFRHLIKDNFIQFSALSLIGLYWASSVEGRLNIGVRHVLPTFPLIYILVSSQISEIGKLLKEYKKILYRLFFAAIIILMIYQAASVIKIYPYFLAYFNEIVGGPNNAYKYVVDSNLDWGQDLKRLAKFVDDNKIDKINTDYFGWADPVYYLKDKFVSLWAGKEIPTGWIAISATFYQNSRQNSKTAYPFLLPENEIVDKIGHSIFIFHR